jgi:hypothetical protein
MNWEYLGKYALPPGAVFPKTVETWRAKVPGGWLVLTTLPYNSGIAQSTTFYPDPAHEWDGQTLP